MRLGIDFGTTHSGVATFDGVTLHTVHLDAANENPYVMPSLIYFDRNYNVNLGTAAAQAYLDNETGRRIVWEKRDIGAIQIIVAGTGSSPIVYWQDVNILTDVGARGRLLQSIKTALRDPHYEGTRIFDRYYTADELIALLLGAMKAQAEAQLGTSCSDVVLGRPVRFSDDATVDTRAEEILYRAARLAGFARITFQAEPIAVAWLHHRRTAQRQRALIFDFGGGTLDLTVAEIGGEAAPRVLATHGLLLGGDDLDRAIMRYLLKYFGAQAMVDFGRRPFPPEMLDQLLSWQTMPELSRPGPLSQIKQFQKTSTDPDAMYALETLVTQNVGFKLFREIERTKRALTDNLLARLDFDYDAIAIHERLLRRTFEGLIADDLARTDAALTHVLTQAGVPDSAIDVVLRTGGSSLVPAFSALLEERFGYARVQALAPLTSVVGGMAITAYEDAGRTPDYLERYAPVLASVEALSGRAYEPCVLRARMRAYTDRDYPIATLPLLLSGREGIRSADWDFESRAAALLRLRLRRAARVYVIYLAQAHALPAWLQDFHRAEDPIVEIDAPAGRMTFFVYWRDFPAGTVTLGGAQAEGYRGQVFMNYLVALEPLLGEAGR